MASKASINRDTILDAAYHQAKREGIASLSIRGIAAECGVAVGSIYNHFPDKASLVTEVIARFWEQTARGAEGRACFQYRPGQNLDRAHTQFKLVDDMLAVSGKMLDAAMNIK